MKSLLRFATLLMAGSLLVLACGKTDKPTPDKPSGGNDNSGTTEDPNKPSGGGEEADYPIIALDGSFSDWDAITEEAAGNSLYADVAKGGAEDPIQVFKVSADPDNIYFYLEFRADLLPQNDACTTWGSSYSEDALNVEMGPDDESFREVMHLFIDPDSNDRTGFYTFESPDTDGPAIPGLGCEMCAQFFMFFKPSTGLVSVAFEQTLIGPTKIGKVGDNDQVDGDYTGDFIYDGTYCQDWPDSGDEAAFPLWGWQNPDDSGTGDNDCPRPENWKAAKVQGNIAKVEFCLQMDDIINLQDSDETLACGIIFDWGDSYQTIGPLTVNYVK